MLTSLRTGALDLTANSQGAASGLVPELAALGLPFLFKDAAQAHQVLDGPIGEELAEKFDRGRPDPARLVGQRHPPHHQRKRPIETPADLSGLKIRTPADPMTVDIFQALGAATQQITFGELYVALQQGVVDGQENPLANIASSKLFEVNKFITLTGHKWQSTPFLMSQFAQAKVTPEQLEIIKAAAKEAGDLQRKLMAEADVTLLAEFKANPDVVVNEVDRAPFQAATAGVIEKCKGEALRRLRRPRFSPPPERRDDGRGSHRPAEAAMAHRAIAAANGIDRLVTRLCRVVVLVTGIALTLILTANVAARYAFSAGGLDAAQELPERLFPWFIVAGVVLAAQAGGHMAVDWLFGKLGPRGGRWLILVRQRHHRRRLRRPVPPGAGARRHRQDREEPGARTVGQPRLLGDGLRLRADRGRDRLPVGPGRCSRARTRASPSNPRRSDHEPHRHSRLLRADGPRDPGRARADHRRRRRHPLVGHHPGDGGGAADVPADPVLPDAGAALLHAGRRPDDGRPARAGTACTSPPRA